LAILPKATQPFHHTLRTTPHTHVNICDVIIPKETGIILYGCDNQREKWLGNNVLMEKWSYPTEFGSIHTIFPLQTSEENNKDARHNISFASDNTKSVNMFTTYIHYVQQKCTCSNCVEILPVVQVVVGVQVSLMVVVEQELALPSW
jgi:hypothetical protein